MPKFKAALAGNRENLPNLLIGLSLIAGIGFVIAALFKFHQHKQNPTNGIHVNPDL
jgi:hypothetical protein